MKNQEQPKPIKLSARKSELDALELTAQAIGTRKAVNDFERLVAACALIGESALEWASRNSFMERANEVCNFVCHKANVTVDAIDHCDFQTAVHRSYSDRAEVNVSHTNDSLLEVVLVPNQKINERTGRPSKRLAEMRVSKAAYEILGKYRDSIKQFNGK